MYNNNYNNIYKIKIEKGSKMELKKGKLFNEVSELILDSHDCKEEIIWLLKKYFKDENDLNDCYNDMLIAHKEYKEL